MQIDLESVASPGRAERYRSQVCIVGGGIAGLVLATTLARAGIEVHLLEAGGPTPEARSQSVYDAEMAAEHHTGTTQGRFRLFGGSSTQWGGQLLPYPDDVFTPPHGVPSASWPLWRSDLSRFYPQIEDLLGVGHAPYTAELFQHYHRDVPAEEFSSAGIALRASKWASFGNRNLAQTLGQQALAFSSATVFFHANATELLLTPEGNLLAAVLARNYRGDTFRFEATHYVLAAGTIETSRLLLASRSVHAIGVGNQHDQVGRGFHDHLSYPAAILTGAARAQWLRWFAPILDEGVTHTAKLEAGPALRQGLNLLNVMAHIAIEEPEDSGAALVRSLLRSVQHGDLRNALVKGLTRLPGASIDLARLAYDAKVNQRRAISRAGTVTLRIDCEQPARPENRIRLHPTELDAMGLPKTIVDWRISPGEFRSIRTYARFLRDTFTRLEFAPIEWKDELTGERDPEAPLGSVVDTYHPMGGTLMGTNTAQSVVDPELRMHGVPNLSLASCSTFPAGGSSNPTFTLMALSLRLAQRLQHDLAKAP